jgi:hypothetical protein
MFRMGCLDLLLYEDVFQDDIKTEVMAEKVMRNFVEKVSKMDNMERIVDEMRKSGNLPGADTMQFGIEEVI